MTWLSGELLTGAAGVLASTCAGVAGIVRFRAWWQDRARQRRIESATYFNENGREPWQIAFGNQQLIRANFAVLTGIDRAFGHESIIRCHARLGGSDEDWETLRGVGHFLIATGYIARIRKLRRRDHLRLLIAGTFAFSLGVISVAIFTFTVNMAINTDWHSWRLMNIIIMAIAVFYASMFAYFTGTVAGFCGTYFNAKMLYRRIAKAGIARRRRKSDRNLAAVEELQLVETESHPPTPRPNM